MSYQHLNIDVAEVLLTELVQELRQRREQVVRLENENTQLRLEIIQLDMEIERLNTPEAIYVPTGTSTPRPNQGDIPAEVNWTGDEDGLAALNKVLCGNGYHKTLGDAMDEYYDCRFNPNY